MAKNILKKNVKVTSPEGEESVAIEIMEKSIVDLSNGMKKIFQSRFKESALVTLLVRASGVGRNDVEKIMGCLTDLEGLFLKPKKK